MKQRGLLTRWLARNPQGAVDPAMPLPERFLASRGWTDADERRAFLDPTLHDLHDASLLPGVDDAAARILEALKRHERIVIYGDYDVDGITATTILRQLCEAIEPECDVRSYIPHRLNEGYGLNAEALDQIVEEGADLIVTVDCGISAVGECRHAQGLGVDLIVTDHHLFGPQEDGLPPAVAVVHPRLPGSEYPFGDLSGAGVAFKLAWRLATMFCGSDRVSPTLRATLLDQLPFAALGTIADVVPLLGENRVLAKFGLRRLRDTDNLGLNALIHAAGLDDVDRIEGDDVGFRLAPRLNAAGRMGHASDAIELFDTRDARRAMEIAGQLEQLNQQRQATERQIFSQAMEMLEQDHLISDDRRIIILAHEEWHAGVVGIVCSRLVNRYHRPAILMQREGGMLKGSARSIEGFSIHAALEHASSFLTSWGGHEMAAGVAMAAESLEGFVAAMLEYARAHIAVEQLDGITRYDCEVRIADLTPTAVRRLHEVGPFGRDHPSPSVVLRDVRLSRPPQLMGGGGKHLSLFVTDGLRHFRLVGWSKGWMAERLANGCTIECICEPKLSTFNGILRVEGELKDLAVGAA